MAQQAAGGKTQVKPYEPDVLVVGAGPAGMCAAIEATKLGAKVLLIDDKAKMGGQLVKQTHSFFGCKAQYAGTRGIDIPAILEKQLADLGVEIWLSSPAVGFFQDGVIGVTKGDRFVAVKPKKLIVAAGAQENLLPFPNCDLPGVYGAGAVQTLMNEFGVVPGKRVLMVGAGNIGLIVSYQLMQAGVEVVCLVEAMNRVGGYHVHADKLRRLGVPVLLSHSVKSVGGKDKVERAVITKLDNFKPIEGSEFEIEVDTVCLAVGLQPLSEILWNAGCEMKFVPVLGGYVAWHDEDMRTSNPDIYVAGDVAGIGEASSAMVEGRIAGVAAATAKKNLGGDKNVVALLQDFKCQIGDLRNGPFGEKTAAGKCMLRSIQPPAKKDSGAAPVCVPGQPCDLKGTKAVIECFERIPCNPCVEACKQKAIVMGSELVDLPVFVPDMCSGCGICLTKCPGLAIFLVNKDYSPTEAEVTIPFEFLPVPDKGQPVFAVNKDGKPVCKAIVSRVRTGKTFDRKTLVSLVVPKEFADDVRHFSIAERKPAKFDKKPKTEPAGEVIVCRCEEITKAEIEKEMDAGSDSFDELKRILRCGMGSCQGKGCSRLILGMLSQRFGGAPGTFRPGTQRTPLKPVSLDILGKD